jgi:hypothetical protein
VACAQADARRAAETNFQHAGEGRELATTGLERSLLLPDHVGLFAFVHSAKHVAPKSVYWARFNGLNDLQQMEALRSCQNNRRALFRF